MGQAEIERALSALRAATDRATNLCEHSRRTVAESQRLRAQLLPPSGLRHTPAEARSWQIEPLVLAGDTQR